MVSRNRLLGMDYTEERKADIPEPVLKWLYSVDCPEGVLLKSQKDIDAYESLGWKDHPGKVRLLPGHEHLFEEEVDLSSFGKSAVKGSKIDLSAKTKRG